MVAGCGAKTAKFLLFIINFCVWAVGIILIGIGAWVLVEADRYEYLFGNQDTLTIVAGIIIGTGCFIFLVGFCACCGALKEIVCLLQVYALLIVLVLILEIVAAILAFVFQEDLINFIETELADVIQTKYGGEDTAATQSIDLVQKDFKCCGANNVTDWKTSEWANSNPSLAAPTSCCKDEDVAGCNAGTPGIPTNADAMNIDGCVDAFTQWIKDNYLIVGGVCLGLLVFEVLALIFSCCLISGIKKGDYS